MLGEELDASDLTERGFVGDRSYALLDPSTGMVVSAKNPRKWARMFEFRAEYVTSPRTGQPLPPVRITCPDGAIAPSDRDDDDPRPSAKILPRRTLRRPTFPSEPRRRANPGD